MELSPGSFRTFVVGTSYQLGNLVSSASSTIETTIGERFPLPPKGKIKRYEYGKVICIFMGCVFAYVILLAVVGPENLGQGFGVAHDRDLAEAAGGKSMAAVVGGREDEDGESSASENGGWEVVKVVRGGVKRWGGGGGGGVYDAGVSRARENGGREVEKEIRG